MNKKKNNKRFKLLSYIYVFFLLVFLLILYFINFLPIKYYLIILLALLVFGLVIWFFLACPKIKQSIKKVTSIISIILIICYLVVIAFVLKTFSFLNIISASDDMTINYSVLVLKDSKYEQLSDLTNKKMGYYKSSQDANDSINVSVDFDSYNSLDNMVSDLLNKKVESIIIEDTLKDMISEDKNDLNNNTKVIYSFAIKSHDNTNAKKVNVSKDCFNVYISGIDTYGEISSVSRSDVNMVATINPTTKTILLTSIPRDYYVELYGKNGSKDKLTHAGIYGVDTSIKTIENLLDIDINYYVKVNFTSVIDIVDTIGGLTIESDYEFTAWDGTHFNKGTNYLNGEKTLSFARERHAFSDGDRQRGRDQEIVLKAMISKVTSPSMITKYDSLLSKLSSKVQTNMTQKEIMSLVKMQLNDNASWNVETNSLDGENGYEYTYSYSTQKLYVMVPIQDSIDSAKEKIREVGDGNEN